MLQTLQWRLTIHSHRLLPMLQSFHSILMHRWLPKRRTSPMSPWRPWNRTSLCYLWLPSLPWHQKCQSSRTRPLRRSSLSCQSFPTHRSTRSSPSLRLSHCFRSLQWPPTYRLTLTSPNFHSHQMNHSHQKRLSHQMSRRDQCPT